MSPSDLWGSSANPRVTGFAYHFANTDWERRLAAGGDEENRTLDPLLARQVLSHLSYTPVMPIDNRHYTIDNWV